MRKTKIVMPLVLLGLAMVMGCAKPPVAEVDAAKATIQAARDAGAADYAASSLRDAESAVASLDAELQVQEKKFALLRSYKQASTLAASAKTAGEKAAADAAAGKEKARVDAEALLEQAKAAADEADQMLATAPAGKDTKAEIETMKNDLMGVRTMISEGEAAHQAQRYLESKAKFESALSQATNIKTMVEQAKAAKAAAKAKRS